MTKWASLAGLLLFIVITASAQIDPVKRQLLQIGYNAALEGHAPISGYGYYYRNQPDFLHSNPTLRLALAPVYLDSELGISQALGEFTDIGVGLAGGGFADTYSEIRDGKYYPSESFRGHGGESSLSLYRLVNPGRQIPLNLLVRGIVHYSTFSRDHDTDDAFELPEDHTTFSVRTGIRWGGQPSATMQTPPSAKVCGRKIITMKH